MSFLLEIRSTKELGEIQIEKINRLKNQHWVHSREEHIKWFEDNIEDDDKHVLVWETERSDTLIAYLDIIYANALIDKRLYSVLGIGNVCVDHNKQHMGVGIKLMSFTNSFIKETSSCGMLLCREEVTGFYSKSGWIKREYDNATMAHKSVDACVMTFDPLRLLPLEIVDLSIARLF